MKFRKKPVVIEAVQIEKGMFLHPPKWLSEAVSDSVVFPHGMHPITRDEPWVEIKTLEGTMRGGKSDWIIKGIKGELYPCRNDIFEATYESVEESHE